METDSGTDSETDSNLMATLHYAETVHIAQTWIPTPYFCIAQEAKTESESGPESVSGNVNEPYGNPH